MHTLYLLRNDKTRRVHFACAVDPQRSKQMRVVACIESTSAPVIAKLLHRIREVVRRPIVQDIQDYSIEMHEMAQRERWLPREHKVAADWLSVVCGSP